MARYTKVYLENWKERKVNENGEIYFKIVTTIITFLLAYHKYILSLFEKKVDKTDCEKERIFAEKFRKENIKTLADGINRIEERMTRIEEQLIKQNRS